MTTTIAPETNAMEGLIIRACGARSITEYAKSCGISPMHVSRMKSGICRPSKKMCVKLSSDPFVKQSGISAEDFMKAAGYTDEDEIESTLSFGNMMGAWDTIALGIVSKALMGKGTAFQLVPFGDKPDVDFAFEVLDGSNLSCICIGLQNYRVRDYEDSFIYYYFIGRLLTLNPDEHSQYVLILDDEEVFERTVKNAGDMEIRTCVSLVLLDPVQMIFLKEAYLGSGERFLSLL